MNGAQAARRAFAGKGGAIVNIASNAGKVGFPNMAAYNATKAAVINLRVRSPANGRESASTSTPSVPEASRPRCCATWRTSSRAETGRGSDELFAAMVPAQLGRHIQPIEIGRVVVFLLTEAAEVIRGQSINLDGGDTPY